MKKLQELYLRFVFKLKRLMAGWYGEARLDYKGADLFIAVNNLREHKTRAHSCAKEPETVAWLESWKGKATALCDIGANIGQYSLIAGHLGMQVYACEPAFQNAHTLNRNVSRNGLDEKIACYQVAFGQETKIGTFHYLDASSGSAKGYYNDAGKFAVAAKAELEKRTLVYRLDDFLEQFDLAVPTMLKIDVDGGEEEVLQGAPNTLSNPALKTILIEVDEELNSVDRILTLVEGAGFAVSSKHPRSRKAVNYIFERA